jgi:hypothetical protein
LNCVTNRTFIPAMIFGFSEGRNLFFYFAGAFFHSLGVFYFAGVFLLFPGHSYTAKAFLPSVGVFTLCGHCISAGVV